MRRLAVATVLAVLAAGSDGTWLTPAQALARAKLRPKVKLTPSSAFFCLL